LQGFLFIQRQINTYAKKVVIIYKKFIGFLVAFLGAEVYYYFVLLCKSRAGGQK